jgi:hypothetical protein
VRQLRERLTDVRHRNRLVLPRVIQPDTALDRFLEALRWYAETVAAKDNWWARDMRNARYVMQPIGEAAVGLCEACADLQISSAAPPMKPSRFARSGICHCYVALLRYRKATRQFSCQDFARGRFIAPSLTTRM